MLARGYFGIAMYHPKNSANWGSLLRTAQLLGASYIATIGQRFKTQASDTGKSCHHIPVFRFKTFEDFKDKLPHGCKLIGIELSEQSKALKTFKHPERAVYLLGAEDHGLPPNVLDSCHEVIQLAGKRSMNVAVAGSIVLYHREEL